MRSTNHCWLPDEPPAVRRAAARDRTADLARVIRHALTAEAPGPLDRAIRAAAAGETDYAADVDARADVLARRLNDLLAHPNAVAVGDPHGETVRW